jgi:SAM-dependent methyltransferase
MPSALLKANSAVKSGLRSMEDWWFDRTRSIATTGNVAPNAAQIIGEMRDSQIYAPVRVVNAHAALRDLPVHDYSRYTFLDIGSGKGRMLSVAAEYPFKKVQGIEFDASLHEQAIENIQRYHFRKQRCPQIESTLANAAEFEFPPENLVLYLFNPFGPSVMNAMLSNLQRAIKLHSRHVVVVLLWPELSHLVAQMPEMNAYRQNRRYHIYQTLAPVEPKLESMLVQSS